MTGTALKEEKIQQRKQANVENTLGTVMKYWIRAGVVVPVLDSKLIVMMAAST